MVQVGPSAQTLAAIKRLSPDGIFFASVPVLAAMACLETRTVKRHLAKLVQSQWIKRTGRQKRRTVTFRLPDNFMNPKNYKQAKFAMLPRWSARLLPTWAERAVFACILSRDSLCVAKDFEEQDPGCCYDRRIYPERILAKDTGLTQRIIRDAKRKLVERGLIEIDRNILDHGDLGRFRSKGDTIYLNLKFKVPNALLADRVSDTVSIPYSPIGKNVPTHRKKCPYP